LHAADVLDAVDDLEVAMLSSMKPASLVWYQPSAVSTSAVASRVLVVLASARPGDLTMNLAVVRQP
jgi:hypothetical protein